MGQLCGLAIVAAWQFASCPVQSDLFTAPGCWSLFPSCLVNLDVLTGGICAMARAWPWPWARHVRPSSAGRTVNRHGQHIIVPSHSTFPMSVGSGILSPRWSISGPSLVHSFPSQFQYIMFEDSILCPLPSAASVRSCPCVVPAPSPSPPASPSPSLSPALAPASSPQLFIVDRTAALHHHVLNWSALSAHCCIGTHGLVGTAVLHLCFLVSSHLA